MLGVWWVLGRAYVADKQVKNRVALTTRVVKRHVAPQTAWLQGEGTTKMLQKSSVKENGVGNGNVLPAAMLGRPFSGGGHPGRFLCDQTKVVRAAVL